MSGTHLVLAERLVTASVDLAPAMITVTGDRFASVTGLTERPQHDFAEMMPGIVVPAFFDMHTHGALGTDFGQRSTPHKLRAAIDYHASHGSTRIVASVATASPAELVSAVEQMRPMYVEGLIDGIHLEGPYLSPERAGAHNRDLLRAPSQAEVAHLLEMGAGAIRMITIAPELDGALPLIQWIARQGITVALGHSNCDSTTARAALDAGATVITHLFNGMSPFHHRNSGLAGLALTDTRAIVEVIMDPWHLSPEAKRVAVCMCANRTALVSDAMQAAGLSDGVYQLAGSTVHVVDGAAYLADGSSLAGSTSTVSDGFAQTVLAEQMALPAAISATTHTPARALGVDSPDISAGSRADLVVLDAQTMRPTRVMRNGQWLT